MSLTDIAEVKAALEEAARVLNGIQWHSADKDNMEFTATITYSQMAALAALSRMERSAAPEGRRWRHVTSGMSVTEIGRGRMQTAEPIGDMTPIVIYHHAGEHGGGTYWARPVKEFDDGRFVEAPAA